MRGRSLSSPARTSPAHDRRAAEAAEADVSTPHAPSFFEWERSQQGQASLEGVGGQGEQGVAASANDALSDVVSDAVQGSSVEELEAEYQKLQASSHAPHAPHAPHSSHASHASQTAQHLSGFVVHAERYAGAVAVEPSPRSQHLSAFVENAGRYGAGGGGGRDEHTTSPF